MQNIMKSDFIDGVEQVWWQLEMSWQINAEVKIALFDHNGVGMDWNSIEIILVSSDLINIVTCEHIKHFQWDTDHLIHLEKNDMKA